MYTIIVDVYDCIHLCLLLYLLCLCPFYACCLLRVHQPLSYLHRLSFLHQHYFFNKSIPSFLFLHSCIRIYLLSAFVVYSNVKLQCHVSNKHYILLPNDNKSNNNSMSHGISSLSALNSQLSHPMPILTQLNSNSAQF